MARQIRYVEAGRVDYRQGLALQQAYHDEVREGAKPVLLSLEHDPVYTLGRRDAPDQFMADQPDDIPVIKTDRGGEITYHGPGQAVLYVILRLTPWRLTLPVLVGWMEEAIIRTADQWGFEAQRREGWRGVFVGPHKLASIGLAVHHDVTMHGLALNVSNDLEPFSRIHPCGLPIEMCSLHSLGAEDAQRPAVAAGMAEVLAGLLRAELIPTPGASPER